jgi:hypothetical protein
MFAFARAVAKLFTSVGLLHDLVPNAVRIGRAGQSGQCLGYRATLREIREAARVLGLQIAVLKASASPEIEAAFATLARDWPDALFVAPAARAQQS